MTEFMTIPLILALVTSIKLLFYKMVTTALIIPVGFLSFNVNLPNPKGCPPMRTIFQSSPEALVKRTLFGNLTRNGELVNPNRQQKNI